MLKQRIITAAVGVPIVLLAIWFGDPWFSLLIAAATSAGIVEFYRMANFDKREPLTYFGLLWALAIVFSPLVLHYENVDILPVAMTAAIVIS